MSDGGSYREESGGARIGWSQWGKYRVESDGGKERMESDGVSIGWSQMG